MKPVTIFAAALGLAAGAAMAQESPAIDANEDGMVSLEEATAAYSGMTEETFNQMDQNADGVLDADEMSMARDAGMLPPEG